MIQKLVYGFVAFCRIMLRVKYVVTDPRFSIHIFFYILFIVLIQIVKQL